MEFEEEIVGVKKPEGNVLDFLEREYRRIGEKFGYVIVQSPLFLMLKKHDSQVGFEVQFGNENEFEESLGKLSKSGSQICFFITSSRAHTMRLEDVRALLLKKFKTESQKYIFVDLESGRHILANAEWEKFSSKANRPDWAKAGPMPSQPVFRERRKKIFGFRGKHKEQD